MEKLTITATIPTAQYANIQPTFDVEADTHEAAVEIGLQRLQHIWDRVGQKPLEINRQDPKGVILQCRVSGQEIVFDPIAHTYHDRQGNRYMGGSTFAGRFSEEFPTDIVADRMATKYDVVASDIKDMWKLNAEASTSFGTSLHAALELYGKYLELSQKVKDGTDESALTKNPVLRPIVEAFFTEERRAETAYYEEFCANAAEKACGLIDRLVVESDGLVVEDYKSNADVHKSEKILPPFSGLVPDTTLGAYFIQGSYYARILMAHGRIVKAVRIHHWDGAEWVTYENPVIDITPGLEAL